ncbi:hypothetical protein EVAR_102549_1 [Eumeta japonica]|uniref:Uncharacterized protein n=1 Tax=Eumeta variegata TaxID=151549 RepID=A0A4C2A602_EUMVA|nr:hypothetical protein EVAR_102549_1 [Eumeta japonica]
MLSIRAEPRGYVAPSASIAPAAPGKVALYKGYIRSRLTYAAPACALLAGCLTSLTRAPSSGTSHRCKRVAERPTSGRIDPNTFSQTLIRRGHIPDEKTPGLRRKISPPSRICTLKNEGVETTNERTPTQLAEASWCSTADRDMRCIGVSESPAARCEYHRSPGPDTAASLVPVPKTSLPEPVGSVEQETEIDTDTSSGSSSEPGKEDDYYDTITGALAAAVKRSRDALSLLSLPTQESAPKKADQWSFINAETPRSPSPESYAEITLNSTAYAALAVEAGEGEHYLFPPPTYLPSKRMQRWPPVLHV